MARRNDRGGDRKPKEFDEVLLEVRRVTRVTTGGRQLSFRAIIVIGNRKGKIGLGVAKGSDVSIAVRKATREAHKNIIVTPITESLSVPYEIVNKYKAAVVKLIPAAEGTGLKAGSSVRTVLELAGYNNILSKIMGTNNKLNNAIAVIQALDSFKDGKFGKKKKTAKKDDKTTDTEKRPAAKKAASKKPAAKKASAKKAPAKKPAAKKPAAKKKAE